MYTVLTLTFLLYYNRFKLICEEQFLNKYLNINIVKKNVDIWLEVTYESKKFNVSFFTDGIISQVLKYFNGTNLTLDEISNYAKVLFKTIFN